MHQIFYFFNLLHANIVEVEVVAFVPVAAVFVVVADCSTNLCRCPF
jgi:hypothetical protein